MAYTEISFCNAAIINRPFHILSKTSEENVNIFNGLNNAFLTPCKKVLFYDVSFSITLIFNWESGEDWQNIKTSSTIFLLFSLY